MNTKNNCLWIGIGTVINDNNEIYSELIKVNSYLVKEMSGGLAYSGTLRPHLNFYDLSVHSDNINYIDKSLSDTLKNQKPIECEILGIKFFKFGIIYVEIKKNKQLVELHQKILESVSPHKGDCIDPDYQKLTPKLSEEQNKSLNKFGNPYMSEFKPHITLGYLPNKLKELEGLISKIESMLLIKKFTLNRVDLVKGKDSKETEVVAEYKFLNK